MAAKKKKEKLQYYTISFEKYIEIMEEVNKTHYIIADKIKSLTTVVNIDEWPDSPISDFMDAYITAESFKIFLDEKINNPTEEEIKFTAENNIKDVLFKDEELKAMQSLYIALEAKRKLLYVDHNFSTEVN